ncbi:sodium/potassium-transporting ATPase subunit alpha-A [Drosophila gunungcola]|uniref:sodium/potassium-transporting ATPase subunit alpha-A n=1 Tax=Drosophila gunungcola TaxID=103775 RepID=UPI0022E922E6|nr:sodium/potassium-transporting ATPase subunit alpha-A [Drosophila gunungcola]
MVLWLKQISKWKGRCRCRCRCRFRCWRCKARKRGEEEVRQTENELWLEFYGPYLHIWPFQELCSRLETNVRQGLTAKAAAEKLARNGKNVLPLPLKQDVQFWKFIKDCFSILGIFILLCSFACFAIYFTFETDSKVKGKTDPEFLVAGIILLFCFFLSGLVLYLQDDDNEDMVMAFDELMPMYCTVLRDGKKMVILTQDVVIGDIVPIRYGQRIPADLRFFSSSGLEVNNVALTGYSKPVNIIPLANEGRQRFSRVEYIGDF